MSAVTLMIIHLIVYMEKPGINYRYPEDSIVLA
jgi:hypothetical protein